MRGYVKEEELDRYNGIQDQIKQNSADWAKETNPERRAGLHRANEYLYSSLDKMDGGKSTFNPDTGKWNTQYWFDNSWQNSPVPSASKYVSPFSGKIDNGISNLENKKFSYNPESDPSYQAYKRMYNREGDRALKSTLSSVSAAQGGISSYASQAAQQASNYYAQQLTDKIPELEQLAYQKYQDDYNNDLNLVNLYKTLDDTGYNRYADARDYAYKENYDNRYFKYLDDTRNDSNEHWQKEYDRNIYNDKVNEYQWGMEFNQNATTLSNEDRRKTRSDIIEAMQYGYTPTPEEMQYAGMTNDDVAYMKNYMALLQGEDSAVYKAMLGGSPYTAVDPFAKTVGPGHGTTGYTGGYTSGGSSKFNDYMKYEKEPSGDQDGNYQYAQANYPMGGYQYAQVNNPYIDNQPTATQDFQSAQQPTNTAQQQNQASTPQAAQSASSTVTSNTEKNTSGTAEQTAAKEEQKSSARRDALSERGQKMYDQLVKNGGHMGDYKWEDDDFKDYINAYNAYSDDGWDEKEEEKNVFRYPYGSPKLRVGSPKTLEEWYKASGYDPKNEVSTPILTATSTSGKSSGRTSSGRKSSGKKSTSKKTGGKKSSGSSYSSADDTPKSSGGISQTAKDYAQFSILYNEYAQRNTELYKKGTRNGKWVDEALHKEYLDNVASIDDLYELTGRQKNKRIGE